MNARHNILSRLRQAQVPPRPIPLLPESPAEPLGEADFAQLTALLTAAHAEVLAATPETWQAVLASACRKHNVRHLMLPSIQDMPALTSLSAWPDGPDLCVFDQAMETLKDTLFSVDAGLTLADGGLTETGMLALRSSAEQPRSLSLVPPIHICLLETDQCVRNLPEALSHATWARDLPSNLVFISGPSKTADIQQTLAYGAHGPKVLVVILISGRLV